MNSNPVSKPAETHVHLPLLVLARICTTSIFMTYPACLSVLMVEWQMNATQAGIVQGFFTAAFAVSLLLTSFACDRIGAKAVFNAAGVASAISALAFALFAQSFETAIVLVSLMGLAQGGTYTPAIMLVAANSPGRRTASAVGWVLAGMSGGYVISIFLSVFLMELANYRLAFLGTASLTVAGWALGYLAVRNAAERPKQHVSAGSVSLRTNRASARLLTIGYIGHCWELFGVWAWVPAFLASSVLADATMTPIALGLWTALALHLSGFFFLVSRRLRRRPIWRPAGPHRLRTLGSPVLTIGRMDRRCAHCRAAHRHRHLRFRDHRRLTGSVRRNDTGRPPRNAGQGPGTSVHTRHWRRRPRTNRIRFGTGLGTRRLGLGNCILHPGGRRFNRDRLRAVV